MASGQPTIFPDLSYNSINDNGQGVSHRVLVKANKETISDNTFSMTSDDSKNLELQMIMRRFSSTNAPPSDDDATQLNEFRAQSVREIEDLNQEHISLEQSILKMCERIAELRCTATERECGRKMCNVILSPIRRLPPEILGEIFLVYRVVSGRPVSLRTSPAAVLSQVCRSWRQTAISLPPLWDTLRVDYTLASTLSRPQNQRPLRICRIMDLWFERSNPLPLDFSLQSKHLFAGSGPIHSSIVLSISDVSHRIRSLEIQARLKSIFSLPEGQFPILESLKLTVIEFGIWRSSITSFASSPMLHRVTLNVIPAHPFGINLPWAQLTHLDMLNANQGIDDRSWQILIRLLSNLEEGRFLISLESRIADPFLHPSHPLVDPEAVSTLPSLTSLTVEYAGQTGGRTPSLLRNIQLPALQDFHCYIGSRQHEVFLQWNALPIFPLFRRLQFLKSLTISKVVINPEEVVNVLTLATSLERFRFNPSLKWNSWTTSEMAYLLTSLAECHAGPFLLTPDLREIALGLHDISPALVQSCAAMVTARRVDEKFKLSLYVYKERLDIINGMIAPLRPSFGSEGQTFFDVKVMDPETRI